MRIPILLHKMPVYFTRCLIFLCTIFGYSQKATDTIAATQYFTKGDSLLVHAEYTQSVALFKKAVFIYQKAKAWERVARCYNKIAESYILDSKYEESLKNANKALEISTTYLSRNKTEKAYTYYNLGKYHALKHSDYKNALGFFQKTLQIRLATLPKNNPHIAGAYSNLSWVYQLMGEYDKALKYQKRALDIKIKVFGENHHSIATSYYIIGTTYFYLQEYDIALHFYNKSLNIRKRVLDSDHIDMGNTLLSIGLTYDKNEEYDKALNYFNKSLNIRKNIYNTNNEKVAICNRVIGNIYRKKGEYEKALPYLEKFLSVMIHLYGRNDHNVVSALNLIGICYKQKGEHEKAMVYYNKAVAIRTNLSKQNKKKCYSVYNNIGVIYKHKGEYDRALKYYKKALYNNIEKFGEDYIHTALNYNNIGNIYRLKGNFEESLVYYKKALDIRTRLFDQNNSEIADTYNDIGEMYHAKKQYDSALYYYDKSLKIRTYVFGEYHPDIASSYENLANTYFKKEDHTAATKNHQKSLEIRRSIFGEHHPKVALTYTHIANVYVAQKNVAKGLEYYQKAIQSNYIPKDTIVTNKLDIEQYRDPNILLTTLKDQATAYMYRYQENKEVHSLEDAVATYQKADTIINYIRQTYTNYQDKVAFSQKVKKVYQGAIKGQILQYALQKDPKYLEQAFYFAEKSKANTLQEILTESNAKKFTGLPADLVDLEKQLRIDRSFYQSKITEERTEIKTDSSKINNYENQLFTIARQQDSITEVLEKEYPKYYKLKHQKNSSSVGDMQGDLGERTTLLEFFTTDSITYAFTISKNKNTVHELKTPDLNTAVEKLREAIINQEISEYKKVGHSLYTQLIAPVIDQCTGDQLIIIPDGSLWHLNFELLLTKNDVSNDPAKLSYLLKDFAISYANSANVLFSKNNKNISSKTEQECLAFSFSDSVQATKTNTMRLSALRNAGEDLPGTRKEIKAISSIIDGQYYFGAEAVEKNFKKKANAYSILHLALHGEVDNERPENSKLYFTKSTDTMEDNMLYSHELFALDIPAELTVLSACNTGAGKIARGEGIMSLGTAFQYAGTKSLVLTSWEVSDQTTPEIMQYFYTNLKSGMNKAKALQQAKLQYLATANINRTQPFYWGGFYLIGDVAPIPFSNNTFLYWVLGLGILGIIILILFWYRKKSKKPDTY
ncbi:CHAT domain-containing protein [Aquimarina muelleri]|uniref:CHAT domain-containing protein n=1 Tax=Aquimarina muelleri TaxID=279356 RepID=UPI0009D77419|nr:CHAT domain-containing protein [Aquimarina muelleri]MCX2763944.1 CHAT domain-containing protein [Aquimarina muelleri]